MTDSTTCMTSVAMRVSSSPADGAAARPSRPYAACNCDRSARNVANSSPCTSGTRYSVAMLCGARVQPGRGVVAAAGLQRRGDLETGPHRLGEQLEQDLVLAREVVVQRRLPDADAPGDLPGGRRGDALADEEPGRRVEYLLAGRHVGVARR